MIPPHADPLSWPSPLLDQSVVVDRFVSIHLDGGRGHIVLESGANVAAELSAPFEGVTRLRLGPQLRALSSDVRDVSLDLGAFTLAPVTAIFGSSPAASGRVGSTGWQLVAHLDPETEVYGGGESFLGPRLRGRTVRVINYETHGVGGTDVSYLNVPFFWTDSGWGIYFVTGAPMRADLGATASELAAFNVHGDELDAYVIQGEPDEILRRYLKLTGTPGRLPEWAFGVWSSRCSYVSEEQLHRIVDEYEAAECPLDVVHVDGWVEGNVITDLTCNWSTDRARFPAGWVQRLHDRGIRVSLWHNPYVLADSVLGTELHERGLLLRDADGKPARTPDKPDRALLDFTNPDAVRWWQSQIKRIMSEEGNDAFKPDFAEEVPFDAVCFDGRTGWDIRNEYSLLYQRATADAMREHLGAEAVALFCRSGTSGAQVNPCHWVGDTPSTWEGLATAVRAAASLSLSGFGAVSHDLGGFYTPASMVDLAAAYDSGTEPEADVEPELFARWAQWGAFSPVMRFHGTGRREPTAYPEPYRSAAIQACRWRASLRRYLVEAGEEAAITGMPMLRPMALAFPRDRSGRDATMQHLLGPDLLVAPILAPGGGVRVWAPPGRWEPVAGLEPIVGPAWHEIECALDRFPVWVRAGVPSPLGST